MEIRLIEHNSDTYQSMVDLRMDILRRPLGLTFTAEQLSEEKNDWLVAVFEQEALIACCVLTPIDDQRIQLRQMAVREDHRSKGLGRKILDFAEDLSRENGFSRLMMHARNVATGFYQKCGYRIVGGEFIEVGIPHHHMEKDLTNQLSTSPS